MKTTINIHTQIPPNMSLSLISFCVSLRKVIHTSMSIVHCIHADGEDYTYKYGSDSFDDSDSSVPILSDSIDEEEECFTVSLSSSSFPGLTLDPQIATVCIEDDDGMSFL